MRQVDAQRQYAARRVEDGQRPRKRAQVLCPARQIHKQRAQGKAAAQIGRVVARRGIVDAEKGRARPQARHPQKQKQRRAKRRPVPPAAPRAHGKGRQQQRPRGAQQRHGHGGGEAFGNQPAFVGIAAAEPHRAGKHHELPDARVDLRRPAALGDGQIFSPIIGGQRHQHRRAARPAQLSEFHFANATSVATSE